MTLSAEERKAIIDYRIERAFNTLNELDYVIKGKFWNLAANRLYYALFYMCEALLLSNHIAASTHTGVNRMIGLHFVKTGILDKQDAKLLGEVFRMRQTGDYDDLYDWDDANILEITPKVKVLINKLKNLIIQQ